MTTRCTLFAAIALATTLWHATPAVGEPVAEPTAQMLPASQAAAPASAASDRAEDPPTAHIGFGWG